MHGQEEGMEDGTPPIVSAPQFGEPVLSCDCGFTDEELLNRIASNEPVLNAEEYLARVRIEARSIPAIVSSSSSSITIKEKTSRKRTLASSSAWSLPTKIPRVRLLAEKRKTLQEHFVWSRELMSRYENDFVRDESKRTLLLKPTFPTSLERLQWMDFCTKTPPLLHVLLQLDNVQVIRIIKHITKQYECDGVLGHPKASWLFALLARLEIPFTDDVGWTLKKLLRMCASSLGVDDREQEELHPTILMRCLLEDFFGQADTDDEEQDNQAAA